MAGTDPREDAEKCKGPGELSLRERPPSRAVLEEAARELAPGTESAHQAAWQWVVRVCTHYVPAGCGLCVKRSK